MRESNRYIKVEAELLKEAQTKDVGKENTNKSKQKAKGPSVENLSCRMREGNSQGSGSGSALGAKKKKEGEKVKGAGEMDQWVKAPTALPEVLVSSPSDHMMAHNYL